VPTTGSLFDTAANGGLTIAQIPADLSSAVLPAETVRVDYRCAVSPAALPGLPARNFDNTARLKYYASDPAETTNPAANYASNTNFPGPNVHKTRISLADIQSVAKAITATSVAQNRDTKRERGRDAHLHDHRHAFGRPVPGLFADRHAPVDPSRLLRRAGFHLLAQRERRRHDGERGGHCGSTPARSRHVLACRVREWQQHGSVAATNVPARTANASWTLVSPVPVVSKSFNPANADANDVVQVRLGWQNNSAASPMFRCVVTDPVNLTVFNPATIAPVTTPAGYAFAANLVTGVVTSRRPTRRRRARRSSGGRRVQRGLCGRPPRRAARWATPRRCRQYFAHCGRSANARAAMRR
jgi:hypothetical protein